MPQEPKRPVSELRPAELRTIVSSIQQLLWMDYSMNEVGEWNADKQWECADLLSYIATELDNAGLKPIEPPTVIGFKSVDEFPDHTAQHLEPAEESIPDDFGDGEGPDGWFGEPDAAP